MNEETSENSIEIKLKLKHSKTLFYFYKTLVALLKIELTCNSKKYCLAFLLYNYKQT